MHIGVNMRSRLFDWKILLALTLFVSHLSVAQQYPVGSGDGVPGEELWVACGFCHGPQGQGGPALDAPPLAGMQDWYVKNQLAAFKNRWRGMHPDDVTGLQMSIVSGIARNQATIDNIAAYISALNPNPEPEMIQGEIAPSDRPFLWVSEYAELKHPEATDANAGKAVYTTVCTTCHGERAEGNEALGAPQLASLPDWYIHRQLQYFKDGLRGTHADDERGRTMAPYAKKLVDNQAIADVAAYIESL